MGRPYQQGNKLCQGPCSSPQPADRACSAVTKAASWPSGLLYQPGDYAAAIAHTRSLVTDSAARQAMAAAGRAEVERHSWRAAISRVRDEHYQRAIQIYQAHQR